MIKAGEVWIAGAEATIPFLDLGIVQGIEDDVLQAITDYVFAQLILAIDITSIQLVGAERQSLYDDSSEQLVLIAQSQGVQSDAYKTALQDALTKFAALGRLGS